MPYSGDPSSSPIDAVRFYAQDIADPPLLNDNEVQFLIDQQTPLNGGDPMYVASFAADRIAAKYVGVVSITADGVSYSGDQLQQKYKQLAADLRADYARIRGMSGAPQSGGTKLFEVRPEAKPLNFGVGQFDNIRAGRENYNASDYEDLEGWS